MKDPAIYDVPTPEEEVEMYSSNVYFSIDRTPEGGIQLSINDGVGGYRICGPKYDGRSKTIGRHKLTRRDVDEIRRYLRNAFR